MSLADLGVELEILALETRTPPFWWGEDKDAWFIAYGLENGVMWDSKRGMQVGEPPFDRRHWDDERGMLVEDRVLQLPEDWSPDETDDEVVASGSGPR